MDYYLQNGVGGQSDCVVVAICNMYRKLKIDPPIEQIKREVHYEHGSGADRALSSHYFYKHFNVITSGFCDYFGRKSSTIIMASYRRFLYHLGKRAIFIVNNHHGYLIDRFTIINRLANKISRKKTVKNLMEEIYLEREFSYYVMSD